MPQKRLRYYVSVASAACFDVLLTLTCSALHLNFAASGFIHLLLVVVIALQLDFWSATFVSVIANLGLNFYLVEPSHSFRVSDPQNLIALVVFETCALIVSQLSARAHAQQTLAISHRLELEKLCSFSRRLLLLDRGDKPGLSILRLIEDEFSTIAAVFLDGSAASLQTVTHASVLPATVTEKEAAVRSAFFRNQDSVEPDQAFLIRVMRLGSAPTGAIGLEGPTITPYLATAISLLCAIALEREKSLDREAEQSAEQKSEQLRVAVLDALAHEYKTPLTAIRTAAGGLLEIGDLAPVQSELLQLINTQTCRLDSLTTQLLQTSKIDSHLNVEAIEQEPFLKTLTGRMADLLSGHPLSIISADNSRPIYADRDLLTTALTQYLDNAAKYSAAGTTITVSVKHALHSVTISVNDYGREIPRKEHERIFDRFHRVNTQTVSGTGIGLSIVKKIANAHQGKAWVTSDSVAGTTFYLSLPSRPGTIQLP